jgi:peptide/nickel transport system substrate-binding protein
VRKFVVLVVIALALGACSGGGGSTDGSAAETSREAPEELRLAVGGEPEEGYDPTLGWGQYGAPLFQSTLLRRDADLELVDDLATDYAVTEDGLVWTVTIRDDAAFTDGEPVTTEDVAYTYNTAATSGGITYLTGLNEAVAVDEATVEFRLTEPQSTFVNRLATLGIVPEHAHGDGYARNPVGSGPFSFVRWDEGQQLVVERNPDYYGEQPAFERVVFVFTEEDATLAAARAGELHVASVPQAFAAEDLPGMDLLAVESVDNRGIMLPSVAEPGRKDDEGNPVGNPVTSNLALRQAINVAVAREDLVEGVLEGYGSPAAGPVDGLPWFELDSAVEDADPDRAAAILRDGGWDDSDGDGIVELDGQAAQFDLVYPADDTTRQGLALAVRDMLRPVGIDVTVEGLAWEEIERVMHSKAVLFGWGSHDPTEMYNLYHSSLGGVEYFNAGFYDNPTVDDYLDLALGATDQAEANTYWQAAQLDEDREGFSAPADAVWAWLVNLDHTYFVDECLDVGDLQVEPHGHGYPITAGITSWTWAC